MSTSVVIPAAGSGSRMGAAVSKQLLLLQGKPILVLTAECFQHCHKRHLETVNTLVREYALTKVSAVVVGGANRQKSVMNALAALPSSSAIVLVHDAVRPFVRERMILESIDKARVHRAAVVAVPVKDTIKRAAAEGFIETTIDRTTLWAAQTPQAFQTRLLVEAYERAEQDGILATDDASLVERMGIQPAIVMGSYENIKITTPEDLDLAAAMSGRFGA
ncbi:MAG: 2-C-methyl-D-erythritol 4-phosphate cytidylyltransferase [Ignavibacteriales bacterium]|nr:2-C-methyl-D-erythritol 4-phosphate cytidylyltransferase [Ignavibacteriales bacterium]